MKKFDFAILGGDKRIACMAQILMEKGYDVICFGTMREIKDEKIQYTESLQDAVTKAPVVICGIPFEEKNPLIPLTELQRLLRKGQKIFGGIIPEDFRRVCEKRNISCFDFMKEETLTIYNAVATAEGAILEALFHKNTQIHQSKVLVLGYGRCGKVLADKLKGLSAQVTVCTAQSQEQALAASLGYRILALSDLEQEINSYEYIFNTIPETVLTKNCLKKVREDGLIIDIASNQVGADYKEAKILKKEIIFCPGLPGKYASWSCAEQLCDYVLNRI